MEFSKQKESQRSKSSIDVCSNVNNSPDVYSVFMSRKKRMWKTFKRRARAFYVRHSPKPEREQNNRHHSSDGHLTRRRSSDQSHDDSVDKNSSRRNNDSMDYEDRNNSTDDFSHLDEIPYATPTHHRVYGRRRKITSQQKTLSSDSDALGNTSGNYSGDDSVITVNTSTNQILDTDSFDIPVSVEKNQNRKSGDISSHLKHPFFLCEILLKEGHDLAIKDFSGTSDPYVKIKIGSKTVFKSQIIYKNLNPVWNEKVVLPILDVLKPLELQVMDYDRASLDDPMGSASVCLTDIEINVDTELKLPLSDVKNKSESLGYILINARLLPKTQDEKENMLSHGSKGSCDMSKRTKVPAWSSVITVVLIEARDLLAMDSCGTSDPFVKFRLGQEKYRSKHKNKTLTPQWLEQFDLRMFDDANQMLEMSVCDHDKAMRYDFMGRAVIDVSAYEKEKTHMIEVPLEDGAGYVKLLLTHSATMGADSSNDLTSITPPKERDEIVRNYGLFNSFKNTKDIGWLQVKVFQAQGLPVADYLGKSDPFCVIELVNSRLQTHTDYKTLNPEWNKVFTFNIKDIHSVLDITVYDEDRDRSYEFLGKLSLPLLQVRRGERKWYTLKDKKVLNKTKGLIQLEIDLIYNPIKAAIRTFNPREDKYIKPEPKFKISLMRRNIDRVGNIITSVMDSVRFIQSCFQWESPLRSATAFIIFLVIVWCFELYMLPCTLLVLIVKNYAVVSSTSSSRLSESQEIDDYQDDDEDDDEEDEKDKEEKKSLRGRIQAAQEVLLRVQQTMDSIASYGERIKNLFHWADPWLSTLAVIILFCVAVVLFFVPLRYLILVWGINKFTKKLRAPNALNNNELLDFLSRIPSDPELIKYKEVKTDSPTTGPSKKKKS